VVGAIGAACGVGAYLIAIVAALLGVTILGIVHRLE
jgi:uncharacterized membrane protein YhiD involved in acid resistance